MGSDLALLKTASQKRIQQAFRPGTRINHLVQLKTFIAFCLHFNLDYIQPDISTLCLYIEFLANSLRSPASVRNYFSVIKLMHAALHKTCAALDSLEVSLMLRAIRITMTHVPRKKLPITKDMLLHLCSMCDASNSWGSTIKCALLFGYYGFLRRSNLVPNKKSSFDHVRHTCRGDILIRPPGLVLLLKWSKTLQDHSHIQLIPMPEIPKHPLCPVRAYRDMCAHVPTTSPNQPLLMLPNRSGRPTTLTASRLLAFFKALLMAGGYDANKY